MRRLTLLLLSILLNVEAETLDDAVRALGRRVLTRLAAQERLSMETRTLSPVPEGERDRVDRGIRETLASHIGLAGPAQLRVTVSAAMTTRVLVGEFVRGGESTVMMAEYDAVETKPMPARPVLERTLLWEQDDRILDAALHPESGELRVLDTESLTLRNRQGETLQQTRVRREEPWPRDVRGRVTFDGAWLPGSGPAPWPLSQDFTAAPAGENEFSSAAKDRFFTAARISPAVVLLAGADGRLRWSENGASREIGGLWGSDIAALSNPCGGATMVIVSGRDGQSLGLFEAGARGLRPLAEGMTLPGTLSALWPAEGDASATAVVRTAAGRYAAYRVFAGCSR